MTQFKVKSQELLKKIEELIKEGNIHRIIIKNDKGETYIEIPVTIAVLGALFAPILAAVGALAGMAANFTIEVIKKEESPDNNFKNTDETGGFNL